MRYLPNYLLYFILAFAIACNPNYEEPETALDAGRQFLAAVYNGNFKRANQLIIPNQENKDALFKDFEQPFRSRTGFEKEALSKASIQIESVVNNAELNITWIRFLNAYNNQSDSLVINRFEDNWRVALR